MEWAQVKIITSSEASEAITEKLNILGAAGISVEDPMEIAAVLADEKSLAYADEGYIESLGDDVIIMAYFPSQEKQIIIKTNSETESDFPVTDKIYSIGKTGSVTEDVFLAEINEIILEVGRFLDVKKGTSEITYLKDEDWANSWKKHYSPIDISPRIKIIPSWEKHETCCGKIPVFLDPGSAFGTGSHATTILCASFLDELLGKPLSVNNTETGNLSILDLGCGSGILSIIAAKLGANNTEAVDIDEIAVKVAKENIIKNNVENRVKCYRAEACNLKKNKYDLVVANIIADVLCEIAGDIDNILRGSGNFIASGIISEKKNLVVEKYSAMGYIVSDIRETDGWVAINFSRK